MNGHEYKVFLANAGWSHSDAARYLAVNRRTSESWATGGAAEINPTAGRLVDLLCAVPAALAWVQRQTALPALAKAAPAKPAPAKKGAKPRPTPEELWAICVKDIQDMSAPTPGFTQPFNMADVRNRWRQALAYYSYPAPEKYPA